MRKLKFLSFFTVLSMLLLPSVSNACIQKLSASKTKVKVGETITVTANIRWIHRKCELEIDDVNYKFIGVKKLSMTKWKKKSRGKYQSIMKVKITSSKFAQIKMWRECGKNGKHGTNIKFTIVKAKKVKKPVKPKKPKK
jgi:hypothetical protein